MTAVMVPATSSEGGGGGRRPKKRERRLKKYFKDFGNRPPHISSSSSSIPASFSKATAAAAAAAGADREQPQEGHCRKGGNDDDRECHHHHGHHYSRSHHRSHNHQHHHHLHHHLKRWWWWWWRSWPPRSPLSSLPSLSPPSAPLPSSLPPSSSSPLSSHLSPPNEISSGRRQLLKSNHTASAAVFHLLLALVIGLVLCSGVQGTLATEQQQQQPAHHRMSPSLQGFSDQAEDLMFEDSVDVATSHYLSGEDVQADRVMASADGLHLFNSTSTNSNIAGDHILRPFSRREKRNQQQQQQQQQLHHQQNPRANFRRQNFRPPSSQDFALPVVDLKRISGDHSTANRHPGNHLVPPNSGGGGPFFKKRLPLMGNEEGFLLSPPNHPGTFERRQDGVSSVNFGAPGFGGPNTPRSRAPSSSSSSSGSFRRRFGDGLAHESVHNFNSNGGGGGGGSGESNGNGHSVSLRAFLEDDDNELSLNDLDLDDIAGPLPPPPPPQQQGQRLLPKNGHHNHHPHPHPHHHQQITHPQSQFKPLRKPIRSAKFGGGGDSLPPSPPPPVPPSLPSGGGGGGGSPSSPPTGNGAPISQIMPLFFDKFLAEFGNAHLPPLSPEGFSLPPPPSPVAPPPTSADLGGGGVGDLDASRPGGGLPADMHLKPEIGPPLFSNDLVQPSPPSSSSSSADSDQPPSSGPWPKIFRFTDGRINLHDFEREKKRSRVKFSAKLQMASKAQALYNIKRESFLILHGGTFSQ